MKNIYCLFPVIFLAGLFYFAEAKGQFIIGDTVSSQITYDNFPDTMLPFIWRGTAKYDVDLDFDGIGDVRFKRSHSNSPAFEQNYFTVQSLDSVQFVCQPGTTNADSLPPGTVIDGSLNWHLTASEVLLYFWRWQMPPPNNTSGGVCHDTSLYIGVRKISGSDTLYSWIFFDNLNSFKIRSCAMYKVFSFPPVHFTANIDAVNHIRFGWKPPVRYHIARYDNGRQHNAWILTYPFIIAARFSPNRLGAYKNKYLSCVGFYGADASYTVKVWKGENAANLVISQPVTEVVWYQWHEEWLDSAIYIDGNEELWIGVEAPEGFNDPAWFDDAPAVTGYGDKIYRNGAWSDNGGHNWCLYGVFHDAGYGAPYKDNLLNRKTRETDIETSSVKRSANSEFDSFEKELLGYNIYGKKNNNDYQKLNTVPITDTIFGWDIAETGSWSFYVTAVHPEDESKPSNRTHMDIAVWIPEPGYLPEVQISPNPAGEVIAVETSCIIREITFYNLDGGEIKKITFFGNSVSIPVSGMKKGVYQVQIATVKGVVYKKVVIM